MSEEVNKKGRRFSQEQYDMLKRCSEKKDMTEWNEWRKAHPDEDILLEGADLSGAKLCPKYYSDQYISFIRKEEHKFVNLKKALLKEANLKGAVLNGAHLEKAELANANLEEAELIYTRLQGADLNNARLQGAMFEASYLEGVIMSRADLRRANFRTAVVDGATSLWKSKISRWKKESNINSKSTGSREPYEPRKVYTDFDGVGLDSCRIDPGTKQLLEYNIRRMNWEEWYKEHWLLRWPVQGFWAMSDYGMSTLRVIGVFFVLALLFAGVYMNCAYWSPPGIVAGLSVEPMAGEAVWHYFGRAMVRPIYFSVVTMTTLGFGDMYANKGSIAGHILLILQVILGYVLLGALITRFAVLFTAGGPAGKFAKEEKDKD